MNIQTLYIGRGLPGSGKSFMTDQMVNMVTAYGGRLVKVEADQFFVSSNGLQEKYEFDRRFLGAAHDECYGRTMRYLKNGYSVVVANTFSTAREVNRYIEGVKRCGLDKQVNIKIIKCVGNFKSVHNVPEKAIKRMKGRWEDVPNEIIYDYP